MSIASKLLWEEDLTPVPAPFAMQSRFKFSSLVQNKGNFFFFMDFLLKWGNDVNLEKYLSTILIPNVCLICQNNS